MEQAYAKLTNKGRAIAQLQNKQQFVVEGGVANADLAVTGIMAGDTLASVLAFAAGVPALLTDSTVIADDGIINVDAITTGMHLVVEWYPKG